MNCRQFLLGMILGAGLALPAVADAPMQSLWPTVRPAQSLAALPDAVVLVSRAPGVQISLRPLLRPDLWQTVPAQSQAIQVAAKARGSVCGVRSILGKKLPRIKGRYRGCGIRNPVQITSVAGVMLSRPATLNCRTAKSLNRWVKRGVIPTLKKLGGGVASLRVLDHYNCRSRNNQPGAKISEHAKGNAIDIGGFILNDGSAVTVRKGWGNPAQTKVLRRLHRTACGPFGTVLGPNYNRFHQDHFHLDTARYGGGTFCR